MLIALTNGTVFDPANGVDGEVRSLYVRDDRLIDAPPKDEHIDATYDLRGMVVMPGGIDMHTHIGGGKLNIARAMLPEFYRSGRGMESPALPADGGHSTPTTHVTGVRYAEMGYTTAFEPALIPINARHAHMEMADIPILDTGGYAMLGNDDFLLRLLSTQAEQSLINDYVAWILRATQCIGIKVVNPGGINAFKFNQRKLNLDESAPHYNVTPRHIVSTLTRSLYELGVAHALHVHASNLGVPGNFQTTLDTMKAADGLPMHITHIQFHSYGTEGAYKFSSAAAEIAEGINASPNITTDVGQVIFGQTVTISSDSMHQHANHAHARPRKWLTTDIECEAGCGVVPFRYRDKNFVNAMQWAIGLEIFLLVDNPWQLALTTDHPNGGPFTSYPQLIRLLMDRSYREECLLQIHPKAAGHSRLSGLAREYTLFEIAIMTRAAPARMLGLRDRGHLGAGAFADVAVYRPEKDYEAMFGKPAYVFKGGTLVVKDGKVCDLVAGRTHVARPEFDAGIEKHLQKYFDRFLSVKLGNFSISDDEMADGIGSPVEILPPVSRSAS